KHLFLTDSLLTGQGASAGRQVPACPEAIHAPGEFHHEFVPGTRRVETDPTLQDEIPDPVLAPSKSRRARLRNVVPEEVRNELGLSLNLFLSGPPRDVLVPHPGHRARGHPGKVEARAVEAPVTSLHVALVLDDPTG